KPVFPHSAPPPLRAHPAMIDTKSLTRHFGGLVAVDGLSLEIAQGEFFAFLGPNAAGKTTTIKMLSGLLRPSSGEIRVCGFDIDRLERPVLTRRAGELFEKFHLDEYAHELIENLSHGSRQRLVIASALLHDPKVLVIDEPMVGLDPTHARIVKQEFRARASQG